MIISNFFENNITSTRLHMKVFHNCAASIIAVGLSLSAVSLQAQTAVMLDGRVLTQKVPLSPFATEGPIRNLDLVNQGIVVTGKKVTIPATVNGAPLLISGSSVIGQDG